MSGVVSPSNVVFCTVSKLMPPAFLLIFGACIKSDDGRDEMGMREETFIDAIVVRPALAFRFALAGLLGRIGEPDSPCGTCGMEVAGAPK